MGTAEGRRQKAKGKRQKAKVPHPHLLPFAFCLLPSAWRCSPSLCWHGLRVSRRRRSAHLQRRRRWRCGSRRRGAGRSRPMLHASGETAALTTRAARLAGRRPGDRGRRPAGRSSRRRRRRGARAAAGERGGAARLRRSRRGRRAASGREARRRTAGARPGRRATSACARRSTASSPTACTIPASRWRRATCWSSSSIRARWSSSPRCRRHAAPTCGPGSRSPCAWPGRRSPAASSR